MKLLNLFPALALAGGLAACATVERPVHRQVIVIPPPDDVPGVSAMPPSAAALPPVAAAVPPAPAVPMAAPPDPPTTAAPPVTAQPVEVIYFKPDAYKFEPSYRPALEAHAKKLKAAPSLHLVIEAWTDPHGASDYNLALSKKRAETVARFLVAQGVPQEQLELVYHGERRPHDAGSERLAGTDRRVELQYRIP